MQFGEGAVFLPAIGGWHDLTHVNTGMTMPLESQSVTWKSDGAEVQGWLLKPEKSAGKLPLITVVHGGPAGAWQPRFNGPGLLRALLKHGYPLFLPNPRGSFGQGEVFTAAMCAIWGMAICATY